MMRRVRLRMGKAVTIPRASVIILASVSSLLETRRAFVLIFALGLFALAARPMRDPDLWWHLRTGELIVQSHDVPHTDPFSFTRQVQPWINHEWLSDVLIYGVYRIAGWG